MSLCAGLGGGVARVRGQQPLHTRESKVRVPGERKFIFSDCPIIKLTFERDGERQNIMIISPEFPRRGEMIEGGEGELLLAVVAVTAMTLTLA